MHESSGKRKRRGWKTWASIAGVLSGLYVLSPGPIIQLTTRMGVFEATPPFLSRIYAPFLNVINCAPQPVKTAYKAYDELWMP